MSNNKLGEASQAARAMLLNAQPRIEAINNPKNAAPTWLVSASMLMGAYAAGNTGYLPARFEQHFAKFAVETAEVNTAAKEKNRSGLSSSNTATGETL